MSAEIENLPEYWDLRAAVDDHRHERTGRRRAYDEHAPAFERRILINLMKVDPGALPQRTASVLLTALEALSFGEVKPIIQPEKNGRKITLNITLMQLQAVSFFEYRKAFSGSVSDAYSDMQRVYGATNDTYDKWVKRLKKDVGKITLADAQLSGRAAGERAAKVGKWDTSYNNPLAQLERLRLQKFSDAAFEAAGEQYNAGPRVRALKHKPARRPVRRK